MSRVRIVTDSSAHFLHPEIVTQHDIRVVPLSIRLAGQTYREGVDLDAATFFRLTAPGLAPATLIAPAVEDFTSVYQQVSQETDQILSLHMSRHMSDTWNHAMTAARPFLGRCDLAVIDSMTTSAGLALIVEAAADLAAKGVELEDLVRIVRAMLPQVYSVFYVDSLTYLQHSGLLSEAQAILGTMLDIKPFLTIEEGELIPMEKVRTQAQAIDKLVEFVAEFAGLQRIVILENSTHPTERTRHLQERLAIEFPGTVFPSMAYGPSLGALLGPDATGIVVFENPDAEEDLA